MKVTLCWALPLVAGAALMGACVAAGDPPIDEATVVANNASVRIHAASSARTLFTLPEGERVLVLEKQDGWYRIRDHQRIEGWMDESTLMRDSTREAMNAVLAASRSRPVQNTAIARETVNLRVEPGRDTDIIRRLPAGTRLEVLDRRTTPRPGSDATDVWYKVRPSETEIGWAYSQLITFDIPGALRPFTEGRTYTAVQTLRVIEDRAAGPVAWYVVAERRPDLDLAFAFDGVRVFTWNPDLARYETTLRLRDLRGVYPLEVTGDPAQPGFRVHTISATGETATREFMMRGTVPREVR